MSVLLHDRTAGRLAQINATRLGSYLFYGPDGVGKATAAAELARRLACPQGHAEPEAACAICRQFTAGSYPDFHLVQPVDKPSITIEQVRRLGPALAAKPYQATGVRTVLINDAHRLTIDAQNALLKLIEEPPPRTLMLLITANPQQLLATIRSRCAEIYFAVPPRVGIEKLVTAHHPELTPTAASKLIAAAGTPGAALAQAASATGNNAEPDLAAMAAATLSKKPFERLVLAAQLVEKKVDLSRFGSLIQTQLIEQIKAGAVTPAAMPASFQALEQFRRHLAASLNNRVALECLMLELP